VTQEKGVECSEHTHMMVVSI